MIGIIVVLMTRKDIEFNLEKFKAVVTYVIGRCEPARLGAVKLHKVLYYSDMLMYLASGSPITGAPYRRRPFGPTCDPLLTVLDSLSTAGNIRIDVVDYYGFQKKEFTALAKLESNHLSKAETRVLDEIVNFVCDNNTAQTISDFSHDLVWEMVEYGDIIHYHNAIHLVPTLPSAEAKSWAGLELEKIEGSRSKSSSQRVEGIDSGAFRERLAEMR